MVKNRWAGKTIVDLFAEEFKCRPYEYYVNAVECGRIQVEGEMVPVSYIVKSSQKISHFLHRHEPPVMARGVSILQKEPDVVTVYKPASVPLSTQSIRVVNIVRTLFLASSKQSMGWHSMSVHRLDQLVSGLLILARSAPKADFFRQQIEAALVQKQYIAKVVGEFPEDNQVVDANINYNSREGRSTAEVRLFVLRSKTLQRERLPVQNLLGSAQMALTVLFYVKQSLPELIKQELAGQSRPMIRVHLQYLGHPIANDMLYLSAETVDRSSKGSSADRSVLVSDASLRPSSDEEVLHKTEGDSKADFSVDPMCTKCPNFATKGYDGLEEGLWLHCFRYTGPAWTYECPYPDWAKLG